MWTTASLFDTCATQTLTYQLALQCCKICYQISTNHLLFSIITFIVRGTIFPRKCYFISGIASGRWGRNSLHEMQLLQYKRCDWKLDPVGTEHVYSISTVVLSLLGLAISQSVVNNICCNRSSFFFEVIGLNVFYRITNQTVSYFEF